MAAEVLGRRWTLLIVRELLSGSNRINGIRRGVPQLSPSVLSQRLAELVRTDTRTPTRVWTGDADLGGALASGSIAMTGPTHLQRAFPGWLRPNVFASVAPVHDEPGAV